MASLYPTTLFHFTDKDGLYKILTSNFKVSYAREKICGPNSEREFAVPMVSFCDIKMADLKYFVEKDYGKFGIGLTKEWANRNSLNPVMYINQHCDIADRFNNGLASVYQTLGSNSLTTKGYHNLINTYRYMKNYEGDLIRDQKITKNYRFADEREWRYVPPFEEIGVEPFVAKTSIETKERKTFYNRKIDHLRLYFQPEDIKYLIVENEDDILKLIEHLRFAKVNFTEDTKKRLASRILTLEQIINDF
ncbi:Putative abortive phage resistance protein AbiGi, antitoxin [Kaistella chaponensis]|uniref:Putative abortive phage resistance protein AbiGi, antitoxin n=1 Tax=Kaistella chaponensis TaxID=713588 RepID=A0A1N7M2E0_9FLAO|nr:abortive infection system antitoxin AbiGi family protein [Kaistella chaponensis]SIS80244.1 Putative abortive phage resistance protein AbiGi, antitoxin [Kaistella chaponensis]